MTIVAIVNPRAGGGRALAAWPPIAAALARRGQASSTRVSEGPGHARAIAAEAVASGARLLVAVGGDGTAHEVANGLFDAGGEAALAVVPAGSGGDFARMAAGHGLGPEAWAERLAAPRLASVDVARVTASGESRLALNTVSLGVGAAVVERLARYPAWLKGPLGYTLAALERLVTYRPVSVKLVADGEALGAGPWLMVVVGNGRYFGGGLAGLPQARFDDGALELMAVPDGHGAERLAFFARMRQGRHLPHPRVVTRRVRQVRLEGEAGLELDGELALALPATVEVLPGALRLVVGSGGGAVPGQAAAPLVGDVESQRQGDEGGPHPER